MLSSPSSLEATMNEVHPADVPWVEWLDNLERLWYSRRDERFRDAVTMLVRAGKGKQLPQISANPPVQAAYVAQRLDGNGHTLAEMFATRTAPGALTDREFLEGHCNGNQFEKNPWLGDAYKAEATAAGVDVTGKVYVSGLASYAGDPRAWVSSRGDVQRLCAERGYNCEGAVTVKSGPRDVPGDVAVADDLVAARMLDRLEADPSLAFKDRDEVFHDTKEQMKPHWAD